MATLVLDVRPGEDPAWRRSFALDGVTIVVRFRWHERAGSWFVSFTDPSLTPLLSTWRVAVGVDVPKDPRNPAWPPGRLYFVGPDPHVESDLGVRLLLQYDEAA